MIIHIFDTIEPPKFGSHIITDCGKETLFITIDRSRYPKEGNLCDKCTNLHRNIGEDQSIQTFAVVDRNFLCRRCNGILVEVRKNSEMRSVFNCQTCNQNELFECTVCHMPRSIWSDDGDVCGLCALDMIEGKREPTKVQLKGIAKWMVRLMPW